MKTLKQFLNREIETADYIAIILIAGFSCLTSYLGNKYFIGFFLMIVILSIFKLKEKKQQ